MHFLKMGFMSAFSMDPKTSLIALAVVRAQSRITGEADIANRSTCNEPVRGSWMNLTGRVEVVSGSHREVSGLCQVSTSQLASCTHLTHRGVQRHESFSCTHRGNALQES